eukprot:TRINITY_DN9052_c0_g1_i1.p1 TRINITY_DN9052_c0_g1~~TRINITY_DN9052_c0_g1_i1.p1  ORF type:complete len:532 (+),score=86.15 TRINITY_DN9052_c0_g1_i1:203-1798(+)
MSTPISLPPWLGFLLIWVAFNAIQWVLRMFLARRYQRTMARFGLSMDWTGIEWKTTRADKATRTIASLSRRFWRVWFALGAVVSTLLMLTAIALITYNLIHIAGQIISHSLPSRSFDERVNAAATTTPATPRQNLTAEPSSGFVLTPLLPGINLPLSQLGYLILALAVNALFHEAGHAIAASSEEVAVTAMGAFFRFLYPGAYVQLESTKLEECSPWARLKITGAGVWHNLLLAGLCAGLLTGMPVLLSPRYSLHEGVAVVDVHPSSPLADSMAPGDVIHRLDGDCVTETIDDWYKCLSKLQMEWPQQPGLCVPATSVPADPEDTIAMTRSTDGFSSLDCCGPSVSNASTHLCFTHSTIPVRLDYTNYSCLPARQVSEKAASRCLKDKDCSAHSMCLHATIENKFTRFIRIDRRGRDSVLYLGSLRDLAQSLELSDYIPHRGWFVSLPNRLRLWLQYMLMVSPALAVMNSAPCIFLDGQYMLTALMGVLLPDAKYSTDRRDTLTFAILILCTLALAMMVVLSVSLQLLRWN